MWSISLLCYVMILCLWTIISYLGVLSSITNIKILYHNMWSIMLLCMELWSLIYEPSYHIRINSIFQIYDLNLFFLLTVVFFSMYFFGLSFPQFACVGDGIMGFSNDIELEKIEKCRRPMQTKLSLTLLYSHSCVLPQFVYVFYFAFAFSATRSKTKSKFSSVELLTASKRYTQIPIYMSEPSTNMPL